MPVAVTNTATGRFLETRNLYGRGYDETLIDERPESVDPCGENGEFHTFVWDGPMFKNPVHVIPGEIVARDGFWFADLKPAPTA